MDPYTSLRVVSSDTELDANVYPLYAHLTSYLPRPGKRGEVPSRASLVGGRL